MALIKRLSLVLVLLGSVVSLSACGFDFTEFIDEPDLVFYDPMDVDVYIDSTMDQDIIDMTIEAIMKYDELEFITIEYYIVNVMPEDYEVWFSTYRDEDEDYCSDDDSEVVACNSFWYEGGMIFQSEIMFNLNIFDAYKEDYPEDYLDLFLAVALHEFGHTFGLDDLYSDYFKTRSIMYYQDDGGMFTELLPYDIQMLEDMYKSKEHSH
jgi:hypothetical protein